MEVRGQSGPGTGVGGRATVSGSRKGPFSLCSPCSSLWFPCLPPSWGHQVCEHPFPSQALERPTRPPALPPEMPSYIPGVRTPQGHRTPSPRFRYLLKQLWPPGCLLPAVCLSVGLSLRAEKAPGSQLPPSAPPCCHPRTPQLHSALLCLLPLPPGVGCLPPVPFWGPRPCSLGMGEGPGLPDHPAFPSFQTLSPPAVFLLWVFVTSSHCLLAGHSSPDPQLCAVPQRTQGSPAQPDLGRRLISASLLLPHSPLPQSPCCFKPWEFMAKHRPHLPRADVAQTRGGEKEEARIHASQCEGKAWGQAKKVVSTPCATAQLSTARGLSVGQPSRKQIAESTCGRESEGLPLGPQPPAGLLPEP